MKCKWSEDFEATMTTRVVKEGNVTTTVVDLTNGVGGRSAEVRQVKDKYEINMKFEKYTKNYYLRAIYQDIETNA